MLRFLFAFSFLTILILAACKREEPVEEKPVPKKRPAVAAPVKKAPEPAEPWASKPKTEWPQMVLTNQATFKDHTPLRGASAFLFEAPSGAVLAATAHHLIGVNGGVEPEIALPELNAALELWVMHPRTRPKETVSVAGLASPSNAPQWFDWLLLRLIPQEDPLPCTPLRVRSSPVKSKDRVHLIGVSYDEPDVAQKVYSGTVTRREGDRFVYDLDTPVNIRGFSGAPIVDDNGKLVGLMTIFFEPRMDGDFYLEAGGEDASTMWTVLLKMAPR